MMMKNMSFRLLFLATTKRKIVNPFSATSLKHCNVSLPCIRAVMTNSRRMASTIPATPVITDRDDDVKAEQYGGVDIDEIAEGDEEIAKLLKILILEVDILRQDGAMVPEKIEIAEWRELLELKSRSSRVRYLIFLFKNEKKKEGHLRRVEERKKERENNLKLAEESGHIRYGFGGSTIFLRIYETTMDSFLNKNLINAALYSQHLVLDCSYDNVMNKLEAKSCAKQICELFAVNRNHKEPFHLQLCNVDPNSFVMQCLHRYIPTMYNADFPFFLSKESYLDLYPKDKLVYLTPHCKNDLIEWNHDDIYIVGSLVDKTDPKPLSLAKAKEQGIRMAKLPLERHLVWGSGAGKSLTINQMIAILLDARNTGNWDKAFQHIPRRKIVSGETLAREDDIYSKGKDRIRKPMRPGEVHLSQEMLRKIKPKKVDYTKIFE